MAAQERIIGGGFLIIGVAIVLVLLYLFTWGGTGPKEAYDQILAEDFPAYEQAAKRADYTAQRDAAKAILDRMDEGGAAAIRKHIDAEATGTRGPAVRLQKLIRDNAFEKNAEGLYAYRDGWYQDRSHRALQQLQEAIESRMKTLRSIRETATTALTSLEEARTGSQQPIPVPAPKSKIEDDAPIVSPNPVYEHDAALYRVFGLNAKLLEDALAGADPGGRSTSARLRWNKNIGPSELGKDVAAIPERAEELNSIATQIDVSATLLQNDPSAAAALKELLSRGATMLGAGMAEPHKAELGENADAFAKGSALVNVLRNEAKLLAPYLATVRVLGAAFQKNFVIK